MAKEYSESPELKETAEKLKEMYYLYLGHVDLDGIYFAEIDGEKPKKSKVGEITGVTSAWVKQLLTQQNSKMYCLAVWTEAWSEIPPNMREWLLFDALYSVDPENDGKIRKPDIQEHGIICETVGVHWRKRDDMPALLGGENPYPIVPPPLEQDDGSTI